MRTPDAQKAVVRRMHLRYVINCFRASATSESACLACTIELLQSCKTTYNIHSALVRASPMHRYGGQGGRPVCTPNFSVQEYRSDMPISSWVSKVGFNRSRQLCNRQLQVLFWLGHIFFTMYVPYRTVPYRTVLYWWSRGNASSTVL